MICSDFTYIPEEITHHDKINLLNKQAFGPGRFTRASFFVREEGSHDMSLSFVGLWEGQIVGSVRQSQIVIGHSDALLLGPLVVSAEHKNIGLGAGLMKKTLEAARLKGHRLVLLVGDAPYYERFGFVIADASQIIMPAPINPQRLLACELLPNALIKVSGMVRHKSAVKTNI